MPDKARPAETQDPWAYHGTMENRKRKSNVHTQTAAMKLRERAIELIGQETKSRLELASIIHELYYGEMVASGGRIPLWRHFGFKNWFDYVETEIGMHVTTASGYVLVHEVFSVRLGGKWDPSSAPSFTKLKAIARVVDAKNVGSWIKRAQEMSCCALEEAVQEAVHGRRRKGAVHGFMAMLTARQMAAVNAVIEVGRQSFPGLRTRGDVLTRILEEWSDSRTKRGLRVVRKAS